MPNQLLIVMDDMKTDLLSHLPHTIAVAEQGCSFSAHRLNTSLCQVWRTTMFTGQWSKDHGVYGNETAMLRAQGFTDPGPNPTSILNSTIQKPLADAGAFPALLGKEFNWGVAPWSGATAYVAGDYVKSGSSFYRCILGHTNHVPPNATYWVVDTTGGGEHTLGAGWAYSRTFPNVPTSFYGTPQQLSLGYAVWDGTTQTTPAGHYLDYLFAQLQLAIAAAASAGKPWFIEVAVTSPHVPLNPRPEDNHGWEDYDYDVIEETNLSLRPSWIRARDPISSADLYHIRDYVRRSLREATAVDRFIRDAVTLVGLDDTDVIITNDNSLHAGEALFRLNDTTGAVFKNTPYDASILVPLICAGPSYPRDGRTVDAPTSNIDIPATIMAAAGATPILAHQHGVDLRDVAVNPTSYTTRQLLHQHRGNGFPDVDTISTQTRKLNRYTGTYPVAVVIGGITVHTAGAAVAAGDVYELYDLALDPHELHNRAYDSVNNDPETGSPWTSTVTSMASDLDALLLL